MEIIQVRAKCNIFRNITASYLQLHENVLVYYFTPYIYIYIYKRNYFNCFFKYIFM